VTTKYRESIMKNLNQFLSFASVARNGSFAAAARELGLAPSSVAKSVARLEGELGLRLFHRTTRSLRLTEEGTTLFAQCGRILDEITLLESLVTDTTDGPAGTLRVGAPIGYGTRKIVPVLSRLLASHRALNIEMRLSDERVNLVEEGLDAAIRIGANEDSSLVARQFSEQHLLLCAAPQYVQRHGALRSVADIEAHSIIAFRMPTSGRERPLEFLENGEAVQIRPRARFSSSHGDAMVEAASDGAGIAQVLEHMVEHHLRDGRLIELLPACRPAPLPVNVLIPASRMMPSRVRALIDALTGEGGS
jgi:DNA-binding transcriptional LysR family regulator